MNQQLDLSMVYRGQIPAQDTDTSRAAARKQQGKAQAVRLWLLEMFQNYKDSGMTADEAAGYYAHQKRIDYLNALLAIRPRITELKRAGYLRDTGQRRDNGRGSLTAVLMITEGGRP